MHKALCPGCYREMSVCSYRDHTNGTWISFCRCFKCDVGWKTSEVSGKTREESEEKAHRMAANRYAEMPIPLNELKQMHGEPVWIEGADCWAIVEVDQTYKTKVYVHGILGSPIISFTWDVEHRGLLCFRGKTTREGASDIV